MLIAGTHESSEHYTWIHCTRIRLTKLAACTNGCVSNPFNDK